MRRHSITTDTAPAPEGAYSSAVRVGDLVQVSGQGPMDATTGRIVSAEFAAQARQTFANVLALVSAAGGTAADVLMVRVYLTEKRHFAQMDDVMASFFDRPYPARTTVFVRLGPGMSIEVDALASIPAVE